MGLLYIIETAPNPCRGETTLKYKFHRGVFETPLLNEHETIGICLTYKYIFLNLSKQKSTFNYTIV